jgi:glycosyltransferase involved in cell wall biosynthesis
MKILFPFVGDSVGGSHISAIELIKELKNAGADILIVLHVENGPLAYFLNKQELSYSIVPAQKLAGEKPNILKVLIGIIRHFNYFRNYLITNDINIVHGNDLRINLSWSIPTKLSGRFFIWHQRVILSNSFLWNFIAYLSHHFIAISQIVMDSAPANLPSSRKTTVWNPFNVNNKIVKHEALDFLYTNYDIPQDSFLIGYIGRLVDYKKVDFLIDCFVELRKKNTSTPIFLAIFGDGDSQYINNLNKYIEKNKLQTQIKLFGFSYNPNIIVSGLDVLVACSPRDAFGRSIVEAMLQETHVLAASAGGHLEIIENGITGVLYEPNNCNDFNEKLTKLINNQNKSKILNNAYSMARNKFSSKTHLDNILSIYHKLT